MKGDRKIVVDGIEHTYRIGRSNAVVDGKIVRLDKLTGRDWATIERGQRKRTTDGMVTPADVERWIRKEAERGSNESRG